MFYTLLGYIFIFFVIGSIGAWGLDTIADIGDGVVYNGLVVAAIAAIIIYLIRIQSNIVKTKTKNRERAKEDVKPLAQIIQKLENMDVDNLVVKRVSEDPLCLSLDEQYEYIKHMESGGKFELSPQAQSLVGKTHMSLEEMEERMNMNLETKNISYENKIDQKINDHNKGQTDTKIHSWLRLNFYWKEYASRFKEKLSQIEAEGFTCRKAKEILDDYIAWKNEKKSLSYRINQGVMGEKRVVDNMKLILSEGNILENIRVEYMGNSAESDIIYIGSTGIYSLEIKNFGEYGSWRIRIAKDGQWRRVYPNGNEEAMKDTGSQLNYHIAIKERFLNEKLRDRYGKSAPKIQIQGAIVIANDTVMLDNDSDLPVLRSSSVIRYLNKNEDSLTKEWQERIVAIFKEYTQPGLRYEVPNIHAMMENLMLESEQHKAMFELRHGWLQDLCDKLDPPQPVEKDTTNINYKRSVI